MARKRKPRPSQKCALKSCGKTFIPKGSQKYCCDQCRDKQTAINKKAYKAVDNKSWRQKQKPKPKKVKQKPKLTDAEQHKINMAVDKKYAVKCEGRRITGPEFQALALQYQERELRGSMRLNYYFNNGQRP